MTKVLLIDGQNLAYRARHRFINFTNVKRESSSVAYGGPFIISSLLRRFPSDLCYVVFDGGRAPERTAAWPDYKRRDKKDIQDNFYQQLEDFREILSNLNVIVVHPYKEEADDYLYKIARKHRTDHKTLVSSDKDFIPMLDSYTKIYNPAKDTLLTTVNVKDVYGFTEKEFTDYLILKGDKSDHIPGVAGLGEVRIREMLDLYGSIDNLIEEYETRGNVGKFTRYMEDLLEVYDRNFLLISLRYFHNKFLRKKPIPLTPRQWDPVAVQKIARRYSISAFKQDKFLKPFQQLCTH